MKKVFALGLVAVAALVWIGASSGGLSVTGATAIRTMTIPDANFTVARTDAANTFTGASTATSWVFTTPVLGTPSSGTLTSCTGLPEAGLTLADNTTNNASATAHGFVPKWPNNTTTFFRGDGTYATPAAGGLPVSSSGAGTPVILNSASTTITGTGNTVIYANTASAATLTSGTGNTVLGNAADVGALGDANDVAIGNTAISPTGGIAIGNACGKAGASGARFTSVGNTSGNGISSGADNTFYGDHAGAVVATTAQNTFVGSQAGKANTAAGNSFFGYNAGAANVAGVRDTYLGLSAGVVAAGANDNDNTFIGFQAGLLANGSASGSNTLIGSGSGKAIVTTIKCTFVGNASGTLCTGDKNTFFGNNSGPTCTSGQNNVCLGESSDVGILTQNSSVAIGIPAIAPASGVVIGAGAGKAGCTGARFVGIGGTSGAALTSAADCTFVGASSGNALTTSVNCTLIGSQAGKLIVAGGADSTFVGYNAGSAVIGISNTFIGSGAGTSTTTGVNNTLLGKATDTNAVSTNNALILSSASGVVKGATGSLIASTNAITSTTNNDFYLGSADTGINRVAAGVVGPNAGLGGTTLGWLQQVGRKRVATQVDATTTTLANLTDLTWTVVSGRSYTFHIHLITTCDAVGGFKMDFNGGTASATFNVHYEDASATAIATQNSTALTTTFSAGIAATMVEATGTFTATGNGTAIPRFAQSAANGTSSVIVGSWGEFWDTAP